MLQRAEEKISSHKAEQSKLTGVMTARQLATREELMRSHDQGSVLFKKLHNTQAKLSESYELLKIVTNNS